MIPVVVADRQDLVRARLRAVIGASPDVRLVAEACDGVAALEAVERCRPDALLIDLRCHGIDAVDAARLLRNTHVIALTSHEPDDYLVPALREGVSAVLLKEAPADDILRAVRTVVRGDGLFSASVMRRLVARAVEALPAQRPQEPAWFRELEEADRELMLMLARGRSNQEIAVELAVQEAVVALRVGELLERAGLRDRAQALVRVYETGVLTPFGD